MAYALLNGLGDGAKRRQEAEKGTGAMDFGIMLIVSNTLMAVFLYVVVKLIWQE